MIKNTQTVSKYNHNATCSITPDPAPPTKNTYVPKMAISDIIIPKPKTDALDDSIVSSIPVVAKFSKVSFDEYLVKFERLYMDALRNKAATSKEPIVIKEHDIVDAARSTYDNITLPKRGTPGSVGYDFFFPYGNTLILPNTSYVVHTGIKCKTLPGWGLFLFPRSSLGYSHRLQLDDTIGAIDWDFYYNTGDEGHISISMTNRSNTGEAFTISNNEKFCQGIFLPIGLTIDDDPDSNVRVGGIGSTGK